MLVPGREKLHVPSVLVIVLGIFVSGVAAIGLLMSLVPPLWKFFELLLAPLKLGRPALMGLMAYLVLSGALLAWGGWQLRVGRSMAFATMTCVMLALPCCTSSCFVLGLPLAIWVFVLLMDPKIRDTFG
ncbi:MAG: hypothetical protein U0228_29555 [Myxococcaceae bacterium]